ncbi:histidine phosphatase family protein [Candidatus Woesearchaeota archaeon]|nr:histidine phosphatase family protein [Candidatus Woesearchaeota archaeon]
MKLKIYLFRHGQTYYNKKHIFTGHKDSKLTEQGFKDAKKVAKALKNKKIDVAIRSHLTRSKQTLKEVLKYHPECKKIIVDDRQIERSYGIYEGKHHSTTIKKEGEDSYKTLLHWHKIDHLHGRERKEFVKKMGEAELHIIRRSYDIAPPKGESVKMVCKRVEPFVKDLIKMMKKERINVAISSHGNAMRPFRKYFEKLTINQMMKLENPWDKHFEYTIEVPEEKPNKKKGKGKND